MLEKFVAYVRADLDARAGTWWGWDAGRKPVQRPRPPPGGANSAATRSRLLSEMTLSRLEEQASELSLHGKMNHAYRRLRDYLSSTATWGETHAGVLKARPVAYFSAEFGLHESLPIYSGGLGILAGDHVKSAQRPGRARSSASACSTHGATSASGSISPAGSLRRLPQHRHSATSHSNCSSARITVR